MAKKHSSSNTERINTNLKTILSKLVIIESLLERSRDKPLTFREACAYLGYAPSYLYKLTYKKLIPHYKPTGKMIFFSKNELDEWIYSSALSKAHSAKGEGVGGSTSLTASDPNQVEMFGDKDKVKDEVEKEVIIEFPLKSRRRKES